MKQKTFVNQKQKNKLINFKELFCIGLLDIIFLLLIYEAFHYRFFYSDVRIIGFGLACYIIPIVNIFVIPKTYHALIRRGQTKPHIFKSLYCYIYPGVCLTAAIIIGIFEFR